ncbi:MAG: hypothetical protein AAF641_03215 [Pseudomonadota bacterium]
MLENWGLIRGCADKLVAAIEIVARHDADGSVALSHESVARLDCEALTAGFDKAVCAGAEGLDGTIPGFENSGLHDRYMRLQEGVSGNGCLFAKLINNPKHIIIGVLALFQQVHASILHPNGIVIPI